MMDLVNSDFMLGISPKVLNDITNYETIIILSGATCIGLDKSGYQVNSFLIFPREHLLWVLIGSVLVRRF